MKTLIPMLMLACAPVLSAQYVNNSRAAFVRSSSLAGARPLQAQRVVKSDHGARTLTGVLGFAGGALVGVAIANAVMQPCECDDPGLMEAVTGIFFGGTLGAMVGVAAPTFSSPCKADERFGKAAVGVLTGWAGTALAAAATQGGGLLAAPILVPWGGSLLQGRC